MAENKVECTAGPLELRTMGDPCPRCGGTDYYCAEEADRHIEHLQAEIGRERTRTRRFIDLAYRIGLTESETVLPTFQVVRREDETGVSGVGIVAYGAVFPNGKAVLAWTVEGKPQSVAVYDSIHDLFAVHVAPHKGKTELRWLTLPTELEVWRGFGK